jgi:hypothetical protein
MFALKASFTHITTNLQTILAKESCWSSAAKLTQGRGGGGRRRRRRGGIGGRR